MTRPLQDFPYSKPAKFTRWALTVVIVIATLALLATHAPGGERKAAVANILPPLVASAP